MKSPRLQVMVIACNYSNMCSQSSQPQGNVAEASPSNDTKDSLTLYQAQQLINQSNSENLVTVTHRNVIANSGSHVVL